MGRGGILLLTSRISHIWVYIASGVFLLHILNGEPLALGRLSRPSRVLERTAAWLALQQAIQRLHEWDYGKNRIAARHLIAYEPCELGALASLSAQCATEIHVSPSQGIIAHGIRLSATVRRYKPRTRAGAA